MWKEFKEFALRESVVDLAVAVVIAFAFGQIISAFVGHIIMPVIGILLGGVSFENLTLAVGDAVVEYGLFIQAIIDFIIVVFSVFVFIKVLNHLKRKTEAVEEEEVDPQVELLTEIRDLLRKQH